MQSSEGDDAVSHCFALNGNIFDPECPGIDGVLKTYQNALHHVKLNGPTNFNKVINLSNSMAEAQNVSQTNQRYNILLILTDGIINDLD